MHSVSARTRKQQTTACSAGPPHAQQSLTRECPPPGWVPPHSAAHNRPLLAACRCAPNNSGWLKCTSDNQCCDTLRDTCDVRTGMCCRAYNRQCVFTTQCCGNLVCRGGYCLSP